MNKFLLRKLRVTLIWDQIGDFMENQKATDTPASAHTGNAESRAVIKRSKMSSLGAAKASLIMFRDVKPETHALISEKYQTISEGDLHVALVPQSIEARATSDEKSQFILVQTYFDDKGGIVIKTPFGQDPEVPGSENEPDIAIATLTLDSFHIDQTVQIKKKTRGILRVTTGNQANRGDDVLSWAFTTAIDLYKQTQLKETDKSKMQQDLSGSVKANPIQMLGGLGTLQVEIIKQDEPAWWQKLLHFFSTNPAVGAIAASFGFPGVAQGALQFLDELVTKVEDAEADVLIASDHMPLAFSALGKKTYLKQGGGRRIGVMNPGTWILITPSNVAVLKRELPYFAATYGRLVPGKYQLPEDFLAEIEKDPQKDPFYAVTYAVFNAALTPHKFAI